MVFFFLWFFFFSLAAKNSLFSIFSQGGFEFPSRFCLKTIKILPFSRRALVEIKKLNEKMIKIKLTNMYPSIYFFLSFFLITQTGAGESGKSTLFKQMKIIHENGFSKEELRGHLGFVYSNLIYSMRCLIQGAKTLKLDLSPETSVRPSLLT